MYEKEIRIVENAIEALKSEADASLIIELDKERSAAGTGLEYYGITKSVFEKFFKEKALSRQTKLALKKGIIAVTEIYTK
jgi:hypothetical protein